ncbi:MULTISPECIES: carbohydrate ABC transporter permease [Rathayibacter]|jgi:multiple sugar transport system permease protein/alpha-1,4-digalacturonate transport system permease protein|uniref:carbohydrate ABC transporter permease n=1 Tax=Rathayibacter TaxID=33886 RepID=UPI000F4726BC|nr:MULTISPECIES: carbohydrate ABC transporter permease [Rathayibacter]MCJ1681792.1 carbohydrate ABC transporter permease [Rathayibacter sp. VKM Ac-2928]MCJ1686277.1 carbohydrate ABC transporter permease [Rathayibacter sp. VKM Ac-2927]MCJ1699047.1 carbohydrate ABC transporter permease [Rathayibacter festucae]ROQ15797.1 carbohydrate ABC transporter membrane protein 2 (CUT1 family) [Rathayibacter sp. PhB93]TDQ15736.1 carbohydrate ABC transporter membrane protein 2 (CUT1 family) [Rathayibacter sp.
MNRVSRSTTALRLVLAILVSLVILFPLYWMLVVAFSSRAELLGGTLRLWPREFTLANFERVFDSFPVATWFGNSVAISLTTALITVAINLLGGYAFAQLRFRGSGVLFLLALSTLTLPVQVIMVSLFRLVTDLGLYGSYWAVILPTAASAFGLFLARQFILAIPRDLIEAARIDGAGHFRVFTRIVLPLSKPLIAVLFFMSLLGSWNDFAWPLIALKENVLFTLPIGLLYLQGQFGSDYGGTMAFALVNVLPMVVLFLIFQRYFVQGFARSGLR